MNVLNQYLQVINSVFPCIVLIFIGFLSIYIIGSDNYQHITSISQNIAIPVRTIYILGTNPFVLDDLKIICSLFLTQFIGAVIIIPFLFIFKVQQKLKTFAAVISIIQINNCITGIPFYSGIYSSILPKYGYMQILVNFGICLPIINTCFEYSEQQNKLTQIICQQILKTVKHPQIIAIVLGIAFNLAYYGFHSPKLLFLEKFSNSCGALIPPFGLISIGMLAHQKFVEKQNIKQELVMYSKKTYKSKIINIIVLQLMRHCALPVVLISLCKGFKIKQQEIVEISVSIYAQPCQIISYTLCNKYNKLSEVAVFDLVFGTVTVLTITPILQFICYMLWE
ncbi:Membrane_transport family protein [Hexamita inflata]|uniref:Membrane transport family protein n=1 Tax=Hexamita inflata TaxID=28002 RepID=A0AA86PNB9_9EUKA|nr:Membrane transport family protein [Hexamita inflata]